MTLLSGESAARPRNSSRKCGGTAVIEAFSVVENESAPEHQSPNAIRNHFRHLADDRSAVAVSDQNDVGQTTADDEVHDQLGRLRVADVLANALAVSGHGGSEGTVAVVY